MVACNGVGGGSSSEATNTDNGENNQFNDPGGNNNPPPAVDEVETESMQITVEFDGTEYPILYNYQELSLQGKDVTLKVSCGDCERLVINRNEPAWSELYPRAIQTSMHASRNKVGEIPATFVEIINNNATYRYTVFSVDENGNRGKVYYFKLDLQSGYQEPSTALACGGFDFGTPVPELNITTESECLNEGSYNGAGYLDGDEGLFHLVYFEPDSDNPGKERVSYRFVDLKNHADGGQLHIPDGDKITRLYKKDMTIERNLQLRSTNQFGDLDQTPYKTYPLPSITRLENGNLTVAFASGNQFTLNIYEYNELMGLWNMKSPVDVTDIKKILFSKKKDGDNTVDVLYALKNDGGMYQATRGENVWVFAPLTYEPGFFANDFDVDFREGVTKFLFTKNVNNGAEHEVVYLGHLSAVDSDNLVVEEVQGCTDQANDNSYLEIPDVNLYDPRVAIGEGGRAYFTVNTWENKWEVDSKGFEETSSKTYQCRENLESNNIANQDHFINSDQWGGIESLAPRGVDSDLLIYGEGEQETLLQLGKMKYTGRHATPKFEWTGKYSKDTYPDLGLSTPHQNFKGFFNNKNFKETEYNVGNIQILGFEYEAIYLSQFLKVTGPAPHGSINVDSPNVAVCYTVSDADGDGINSFRSKEYGISDFDFNDADLDSDNDGLQDYFELFLRLNPTKSDSDDDGTTDLQAAQQLCSE